MHDKESSPAIPALMTEIVAAYVSHNTVAVADFGRLMATVGQELAGLGREPEEPAKAVPAVPVQRSVQRDHLVCLVCGKPFKSLRRHLRTSHELTPDGYRQMFELGRAYPMVAAASSAERAAIAKRSGLGLRRPAESEAEMDSDIEGMAENAADEQMAETSADEQAAEAPAAERARPAAPRQVRGRRAAKKSDPVPA